MYEFIIKDRHIETPPKILSTFSWIATTNRRRFLLGNSSSHRLQTPLVNLTQIFVHSASDHRYFSSIAASDSRLSPNLREKRIALNGKFPWDLLSAPIRENPWSSRSGRYPRVHRVP
jgi:hypothetical protein